MLIDRIVLIELLKAIDNCIDLRIVRNVINGKGEIFMQQARTEWIPSRLRFGDVTTLRIYGTELIRAFQLLTELCHCVVNAFQ